jgi:hypothetical protein
MLKIFFKVLNNDDETIKLVIPKHYVKCINDINYQELIYEGYKNIIFDIDNTIMPVDDINVSQELILFMNKLKENFNICLVSNNDEDRVKPVSLKLNVLAVSKANKPYHDGFIKALNILNGSKDDTIIVGDQMLTDVVGGNSFGISTILVEPYKRKYNLKTGISRFLQNIIMLKLKSKIKKYKYY